MSDIIKAPKGVPDYVPPASAAFLAVRNALSRPAQLAGYDYIELPVYEDTALFVRGVGESTDVVSKEMFTFTDRGERSISLRPEGTAGVMRAVIEHNLDRGQLPVKLWYAGAFFRAERPQAGRYRQLQQVGIEAIGSDDPALDAEVIALADEGYKALGLTQYTLKLTSLGCRVCRDPYRERLQNFLSQCQLDEATQARARLNPLRVLDDKRSEVQQQLQQAPLQVDHLCNDCAQHYSQVRAFLTMQGVTWSEAPRLVRGLDYYTRTTFEFDHPLLGAQSGIGGGGRYDGLMASLGGQELSGIGFGLGTDRTYLACEAEGLSVAPAHRIQVFLIALGTEAKSHVAKLSAALRASGISNEVAYGDRALKGAMKAADKSGAKFVIVFGDGEIESGQVNVKRMSDGHSTVVPLASVIDSVSKLVEE